MYRTLFSGRLEEFSLNVTQSGKSVLKGKAVSKRVYTDKQGYKQVAKDNIFFEVWGDRAEGLNRALKAGMVVSFEGDHRTEKYEKDGQTKYMEKTVIGTYDPFDFYSSDSPAPSNPQPQQGSFQGEGWNNQPPQRQQGEGNVGYAPNAAYGGEKFNDEIPF